MARKQQRYRILLLPVMLLSMTGLLSAQTLPSDDSTKYRFGIFFNLDSRGENPDLVIPGYSPFCGELLEGKGSGWGVGGLLDIALLRWLTLEGRVGFARASGEMTHRGEPFPIRGDGEDLEVLDGRVDQIVDFKSTGIELIFSGIVPVSHRLRASLGLGSWFRLFSEEIHREVAVSPGTLLLANNKRELELRTGTLFSYRSIVPLATAGVQYDLPIGQGSYLSPELRLTVPIIDWTTEGSWRTLRLSLGGSVRFGIPGDHPKVDPIQPDDTIPERLPVLIPDILTDPRIVEVEITEYDSTEALPLLNRVFFEENSSEIPERYHLLDISETPAFSITQLNGPTLEVYRDLLNVIGLRLSRYPDAQVTITGYHNTRETREGLSTERANVIKDYLVETWEIFPERITVREENLPPRPVPERTEEGLRENSHARIEVNNPYILIPVLRNYVQRIASPPSVTFYPKAIAERGVVDWQLDVEHEGGIWKRFSGTGWLPDSIQWNWTSDSGALPSLPIELSYRLTVGDSIGQRYSTPSIPIEVRTNTVQERLENRQQDTVIESYSLLLFDYDSPEVSSFDQALIKAIAGRVQPGATVRFTGYTDSLGDARRNSELARQRAEASAKIFRTVAPERVEIVINDLGSGESERYPFDTPEGRAYNRTVVIEVRTPAK
ncbi:MAG: OmpA family protein [Candidatus Kapaibacterium sp.]